MTTGKHAVWVESSAGPLGKLAVRCRCGARLSDDQTSIPFNALARMVAEHVSETAAPVEQPTHRQRRSQIPEHLTGSDRPGGGDPLGDYLHLKGEGR